MRILHVFNEIKYSGGEIMYANAAPLFQVEGFELLALSTGKEMGDFSNNFIEKNIEVIHQPIPTAIWYFWGWINYFFKIQSLIKKEHIDLVHIHRANVVFFFSISAFLSRKKVIYTVHNVFKNRKITWIKAYFERLFNRKLLKTKYQSIGESVYLNELNYYKNPSIRINNWFNPAKFYPAVSNFEKSAIKKKLEIPENKFVIISVGGCSQTKNHHDIIKAVEIVNRNHPILYLHLGKGGTECEEIELAKTLNLNDSIRFIGNKENVRDYLIASDIFVMTSHFEGLGNAAIEAMICHLPCILYDVPGLRDLIINDNAGFLINKDYTVLATKIIELVNNESLRSNKGKKAYHFAFENFSMENSVKEIIHLYRN